MKTTLDTVDKYAWWSSLNHGGLLIAPSRLSEFFTEDIKPLPSYWEDILRRDVVLVSNGNTEAVSKLLDTVLETILGLYRDFWQKGNNVSSGWSCRSMTGEIIKPRRVWQEPNGGVLPVFVPEGGIKRIGVGKGKRITSRVIEWLRINGQKIALLTNGIQWRLIHAGADYDAWCEWDIDLWFSEGKAGLQVDALRSLLSRSSLTYSQNDVSPLIAAITASRMGQAELSTILGERVRQAIELLIRESRVDLEQTGASSRYLYIAATRMIMRCVFILFAEARDLLPRNNPIYYDFYGMTGLREQLEHRAAGRAKERLRYGYGAYPRLLALFRLVYAGSHHQALLIPCYGGGLFVPGDRLSTDPILRALALLESPQNIPSDAVVYRILELLTRSKVKVRQGRKSIYVEAPVDFSDLSSEYIGILYEGLLDFELRCSKEDDPMIFLNLGDQPVLPLKRLESMDDLALAGLVEKLKQQDQPTTGEETEDEVIDEDEAETTEDIEEVEEIETESADLEDNLDIVAQLRDRAHNWAIRAVKAGNLVSKPRGKKGDKLEEYEAQVSKKAAELIGRLILPNEWFLVRWGGTRKGAGTFYTRPQLAVPTVRRTLEPLVYVSSPHSPDSPDSPDSPHSPNLGESKIPKRPETILNLKICDPSMGSGSFLVAALRYLTDSLYESLHYYQCIEQHGDKTLCRLADGQGTNSMLEETLPVLPDSEQFEERLKARLKRYIVERCIYGVDIDPLGCELARLALWVETMDKTLPFSFLDHKLKCGNALVGCWFDQFQDYPVMAWERKGGDENHELFVHHFREYLAKSGKGKGKIQQKGDRWTQAIKDTRTNVVRSELESLLNTLDPNKSPLPYPNFELPKLPETIHDEALCIFEELHNLPVYETETREKLYREKIKGSESIERLKFAFDTWCAVWFWPGDNLYRDESLENTQDKYNCNNIMAPTPQNFFNPAADTREIIQKLAENYQFFHWELEFPDVFQQSAISSQQSAISSQQSAISSQQSAISYQQSAVSYQQSAISSQLSAVSESNQQDACVTGGFSAVIGNPPWETLQPNSMEFFSNIDPLYRTYGKQEALQKQIDYFNSDPQIEQDWLNYCDRLKALSNWTKNVGFPFGDPQPPSNSLLSKGGQGGSFNISRSTQRTEYLHELWRNRRVKNKGYADERHPFRIQDEGKPYTYKMFLELSLILLGQGGRMGLIVPSGVYTDKGSTHLRTEFLEFNQWEWLFGFENRDGIFDIHRSFKFCPVIVNKGGKTEKIKATFMQRSLSSWENAEDIVLEYPRQQVEKFSPKSKAILEIRSPRDLEVLEKMYSQGVLLGDDSPQGWGIKYQQGDFNMTSDSKLFPPRPQWEKKGYIADEYGHWLKGKWQDSIQQSAISSQQSGISYQGSILERPNGVILSADKSQFIHIDDVEDVALPLYEGRMIGQFDFSQKGWVSGKGRTAVWRDIPFDNKVIEPQYLISIENVKLSIDDLANYIKIIIMDIASATNSRTMYACFASSVPCGHSAPIFVVNNRNLLETLNLTAIYNSFAFDSNIRNRIGGLHLTWHYLEETSIPKKSSVSINLLPLLVARLAIPSQNYAHQWNNLYKKFISTNDTIKSCYQLWAITPYERLRLRCILDAIIAELYGLSLDDYHWILRECDRPIETMKDKQFYRTLDPKGFWRVDKDKDPELRHTVLSLIAFHDLKQIGLENFLNLNDGEGWMLPDTLTLTEYNLGHDARANQPQPVARILGDRFLPWQLESAPEESWQECERHAENLPQMWQECPRHIFRSKRPLKLAGDELPQKITA